MRSRVLLLKCKLHPASCLVVTDRYLKRLMLTDGSTLPEIYVYAAVSAESVESIHRWRRAGWWESLLISWVSAAGGSTYINIYIHTKRNTALIYHLKRPLQLPQEWSLCFPGALNGPYAPSSSTMGAGCVHNQAYLPFWSVEQVGDNLTMDCNDSHQNKVEFPFTAYVLFLFAWLFE